MTIISFWAYFRINKNNLYISKVSEPLHDKQRIPIYDIHASAGILENIQDIRSLDPMEYMAFSHISKVDGGIFAVGDSMYPLIKSGDILLYKEVGTDDIIYGNIYLINVINSMSENYLMIKYIKRSDTNNYIKLASYNTHHSDKDIPLNSVRNLAIIKTSICKHFY